MRTRYSVFLLVIALAGYAAANARTVAPHLIFDDEFDGAALDAKTWYTCHTWAKPGAGCTNNPGLELEWYEPANVSEGGGVLNLVAKRQTVVVTGYSKPYRYTSGMVSTGGTPNRPSTFAFLYGYAEARIKMPCGAGMWPAFWIIPSNRSWPPEIDMMEYQGIAPAIDEVHIHWGTSSNPQQFGGGYDTHVNLCAGYHVYAVDWEPSYVIWYFDNRAVMKYADAANVPHVPMYVILNLAIGGWVTGQLDPTPKNFPATMSVDYLRIWNAKPTLR